MSRLDSQRIPPGIGSQRVFGEPPGRGLLGLLQGVAGVAVQRSTDEPRGHEGSDHSGLMGSARN